LIEIDFNILPAVTDTEKTLEDGSVLVYEDGDKNLAFTHFMGDRKATDQAFAKADHVTELKLINNRLVSNYMETRAVHRANSCHDP